jgi:hypothetical protein
MVNKSLDIILLGIIFTYPVMIDGEVGAGEISTLSIQIQAGLQKELFQVVSTYMMLWNLLADSGPAEAPLLPNFLRAVTIFGFQKMVETPGRGGQSSN